LGSGEAGRQGDGRKFGRAGEGLDLHRAHAISARRWTNLGETRIP
jgi:hypothetical protein